MTSVTGDVNDHQWWANPNRDRDLNHNFSAVWDSTWTIWRSDSKGRDLVYSGYDSTWKRFLNCHISAILAYAKFTSPARQDKTVLSVSYRAVWIEFRDRLEKSEQLSDRSPSSRGVWWRNLGLVIWAVHSVFIIIIIIIIIDIFKVA